MSDPVNRTVLGTALLLSMAGTTVDDELKNYALREGLMSESMARVGDLYGGTYGHWVLLGGIAVYQLGINKDYSGLKRDLVYAGTALGVNGIVTTALKAAIGRERPNGADKRSFPSGHTSHSFCIAAVSDQFFGHWISIPAYLLATLVGVSRINDNKHYLSDVIMGAGLGTAIGRGFGQGFNEKGSKWTLSVLPSKRIVIVRSLN